MRKSIVAIVVFAFMVPMLLASAQHASATPPIRTEAIMLAYDTVMTFEPLNDKVTKLTFVSVQQWGGDWVGTMVYTCEAMIRSGTPTSMVTVHGKGIFEGTVLGKSGTVTVSAVTIAREDGIPTIDEGAILSGTGDLANLRGHVGFHEGWTQWEGYDYWWIHWVH